MHLCLHGEQRLCSLFMRRETQMNCLCDNDQPEVEEIREIVRDITRHWGTLLYFQKKVGRKKKRKKMKGDYLDKHCLGK